MYFQSGNSQAQREALLFLDVIHLFRAARSYLPEFLKKSSNDGKNKEDDNLVDMNKDIKRESSPNSHQNAQGSGE